MRKMTMKFDSPSGITALLRHTIHLTGDVHVLQGDCMVNGKALLGLLSLDHGEEVTVITDAPEEEWMRFVQDVQPLLT